MGKASNKAAMADMDRKRKPPSGTKEEQRTHALLHMPHVRTVPLPEPVRVPDRVNGRELMPWERERRRELALFAGLIG